jgi:hypothetical protein
VTDAALGHIASVRNLAELSIIGCKNVTPDGLKALQGLPSLDKVYIDQQWVDKYGEASARCSSGGNRALMADQLWEANPFADFSRQGRDRTRMGRVRPGFRTNSTSVRSIPIARF